MNRKNHNIDDEYTNDAIADAMVVVTVAIVALAAIAQIILITLG